jgi:hypothetical protein
MHISLKDPLHCNICSELDRAVAPFRKTCLPSSELITVSVLEITTL